MSVRAQYRDNQRPQRNRRNQGNQRGQAAQRPDEIECLSCWQSELHCDGAKPACNPCFQKGTPCNYRWHRPRNEPLVVKKTFTTIQTGCTNCFNRWWLCDGRTPRCQNCANIHGECIYDGGGESAPINPNEGDEYMESNWDHTMGFDEYMDGQYDVIRSGGPVKFERTPEPHGRH
ncbi:hypothetical protein PFICI_03857 [Pestalotiopsis fici W106-1]|uniref:Zn(2)-C6 fungal-type domain-containing protein n=1 Tax=Pestalotiopsis fici (strain W106-1 / CGMCC3.15140) TaxID=1229662 RepID=W3XK42_PESFW|nr:uncharacterized protein PFICI_03857 [Pestalotiopsis fici W106-1]ETS85832.1 hypothetical protein PFICI_03857 [Pestalotiopsis fici W106-1]